MVKFLNWLGESPKGRKLGRYIAALTIGAKLFELVDVHSETAHRAGELEDNVSDLKCRYSNTMLRAAFAERLARRALAAQELDLDEEWRAFLVEAGEVAPDVVGEHAFIPLETVLRPAEAVPNLSEIEGVEVVGWSAPPPEAA